MAGCFPYEDDRAKAFFTALRAIDSMTTYDDEGDLLGGEAAKAVPLACNDHKGAMTVYWDSTPSREQRKLCLRLWGEFCECIVGHLVISGVDDLDGVADECTGSFALAGCATRSSK